MRLSRSEIRPNNHFLHEQSPIHYKRNILTFGNSSEQPSNVVFAVGSVAKMEGPQTILKSDASIHEVKRDHRLQGLPGDSKATRRDKLELVGERCQDKRAAELVIDPLELVDLYVRHPVERGVGGRRHVLRLFNNLADTVRTQLWLWFRWFRRIFVDSSIW